MVDNAVAACSALRALGCVDIEFSPEDATRCATRRPVCSPLQLQHRSQQADVRKPARHRSIPAVLHLVGLYCGASEAFPASASLAPQSPPSATAAAAAAIAAAKAEGRLRIPLRSALCDSRRATTALLAATRLLHRAPHRPGLLPQDCRRQSSRPCNAQCCQRAAAEDAVPCLFASAPSCLASCGRSCHGNRHGLQPSLMGDHEHIVKGPCRLQSINAAIGTPVTQHQDNMQNHVQSAARW